MGCCGYEGAVCGGKSALDSDGDDKGAACRGESGVGSGEACGTLCKAGRSEVVKPRQAKRGGGDGWRGGDTEAADAANLLRGAMR